MSLRSQISEQNAEAARLTSSIAAAEQENGRLEDAIANVDTDAGIEAIAREKLGMVSKDEIVFVDVSD
ncbi:MAG: septum formation initiator family protein [Oscillospiraceae bacterium]|nr:septum formation initiator family protein [Oscillospiraceae bacterium]MBQ5748604.1 septum formation initiator family protein [Oscillospiraceae bacterium]